MTWSEAIDFIQSEFKNELCRKCMFSDECTDAEGVEGKAVCSSFIAIWEDE